MFGFRKIFEGLKIVPKVTSTAAEQGDLDVSSTDTKLHYSNGTTSSPVVTESHTATLTNKTIDANNNTLLNIPNSAIAPGLDATKIADGSVTNTEFQYINSLTSNAQTQIDGKVTAVSSTDNAAVRFDGTLGQVQNSLLIISDLGAVSGATQLDVDNIRVDGNTISSTDTNGNVSIQPNGTGDVVLKALTGVLHASSGVVSASNVNLASEVTGVLPVANGGTNSSAALNNNRIMTSSGGAIVEAAALTNGQLLIGSTGAAPVAATLTAGSNITITNGVGSIQISSSGGGGGSSSSGGADLLRQIADDENAQLPDATLQNQFLDTFRTSKGTIVNGVASNSALRFSGSNTTMTYERVGKSSQKTQSATGFVRMRLQALAPKNTTITSNTIIFHGDVTNLIQVSKNVIMAKKSIVDGVVNHEILIDATNLIAKLPVSSCSYSSGSDETTVVLTNSGSLDLDFDLSSSDYNDKLRLIPFDYKFEGRANTSDSLMEFDIIDMFGTQTIGIPGEVANLSKITSGLTGSVTKEDAVFSPSGQYGIARILERVTGTPQTWHFFYSTDSGKNWTKFATTKNTGFTILEEYGYTNYTYVNNNQIVVADNGKAFWTYVASTTASEAQIFGVYSDLSAGTPTLSNTPATGSDAANGNNTATPGAIGSAGGVQFVSQVAADLVDLSYIAIACKGNSGNTTYVRWYSAGGSTHVGLSAGFDHSFSEGLGIYVTGTSGSHRTTVHRRPSATAFINARYYDEGSLVVVADTALNAANSNIQGFVNSGNKAYVTGRYTDSTLKYIGGTLDSTPSYNSVRQLTSLDADRYNGTPTETIDSGVYLRNITHKIAVNPADTNQVFFCADFVHPDSLRRAHIVEVRDDSSFQGIHTSQYGVNDQRDLNSTSGKIRIAQTFLASTQRYRTFAFRVLQNGVIPSGYSMWCDIYATTAGVPSGSVLFTSNNQYDPSKITKNSNGQFIYFTVDTIGLTNGNTYTMSLEANYPNSASNFIYVKSNSGGGYASGAAYDYISGVWTANTQDLVFEISGEWIYDISHQMNLGENVFNENENVWAQESQIANYESGTLSFLSRRAILKNGDTNAASKTGNPYFSIITMGSTNSQSTFTTPTPAGFPATGFDKNLVFNAALGSASGARQDIITGVLDTGHRFEDRSSHNVTSPTVTGSAPITSDANFNQGVKLAFPGSGNNLTYLLNSSGNFNRSWDIIANKPFAFEFEADNLGTQSIDLFGTNGSGNRFAIRIVSGFLSFIHQNSAGTVLTELRASDAVEGNSYHKVRFVFDGSNYKFQRSTSAPYTTFTDVASYSVSTLASVVTSGTQQFYVNVAVSSAAGTWGCGYIKFIQGSSTFVYDNYIEQPPVASIQNLGKVFIADYKVGQNSYTIDINFDKWAVGNNSTNQSVVDSNDLIAEISKTFTTAGQDRSFKLSAGRASTRDVSCIPAVNVKNNR